MTYFSETVTISSDEEETESETSSQPATPKPATPKPQAGNEVSSSPSQSQTSNNSTEPMESPIIPTIPISSKVDNKPRVDKMEDEVCIYFRFVKFYCRDELYVHNSALQ